MKRIQLFVRLQIEGVSIAQRLLQRDLRSIVLSNFVFLEITLQVNKVTVLLFSSLATVIAAAQCFAHCFLGSY